MTDRPIIFSAPMVRALLAGRKTQTRRILRPQPEVLDLASERLEDHELRGWECIEQPDGRFAVVQRMPYAIGARLWVRETWSLTGTGVWTTADVPLVIGGSVIYRATDDGPAGCWLPSIFMPRRASRITLLVDSVRVERLNDISEADALAEGIGRATTDDLPDSERLAEAQSRLRWPQRLYAVLWDELYGAGSWAANPWVVALRFRVVIANIDSLSVEAA